VPGFFSDLCFLKVVCEAGAPPPSPVVSYGQYAGFWLFLFPLWLPCVAKTKAVAWVSVYMLDVQLFLNAAYFLFVVSTFLRKVLSVFSRFDFSLPFGRLGLSRRAVVTETGRFGEARGFLILLGQPDWI